MMSAVLPHNNVTPPPSTIRVALLNYFWGPSTYIGEENGTIALKPSPIISTAYNANFTIHLGERIS